jgi:hypothetical protein
MDRFDHFGDSVSDPARQAAPVTPSNDQPLARIPKALFVGTGGDIRLRCTDDDAPVLFRNIPSGSILPVRAGHILMDGTSATDLVGLF